MTMVTHTFEPVYDANSKVLILGTFPSVKSREANFYYGHPRNRFWQVLARLTESPVPADTEEKKKLLLSSGIAIWDVIQSCDIIGSSDSSIKNVTAGDLLPLLQKTQICRIFANGATAGRLYDKYQREKTGMEIITLPSTSPANAAYDLERLCGKWAVVKDILEEQRKKENGK